MNAWKVNSFVTVRKTLSRVTDSEDERPLVSLKMRLDAERDEAEKKARKLEEDRRIAREIERAKKEGTSKTAIAVRSFYGAKKSGKPILQ